MSNIAIIGCASWGTALGITLARNGSHVNLWTREQDVADQFNEAKENTIYLPGFRFPARLTATGSLEDAMGKADMVIVATPAQSMRRNMQQIRDYLNESMLIVSAAKGLEIGTGKRMSEVIAEEIESSYHSNICVLSGPNMAKETAQGLLSATTIASNSSASAQKAQSMVNSSSFYVFNSTDLVGVELGGALKNVVAVGAGLTDGFGYGNNAKAALIIRGLSELILMGTKLGANPMTFIGLSALGDLVVTCFSPMSRNYTFGQNLASGRPAQEVLGSMNHSVAEGALTAKAAMDLSKQVGVNLPLVEQIYKVIYEGADAKKAAKGLVESPVGGESLEVSKLFRLVLQYVRVRWQPSGPLSLWELEAEDILGQL